jgi:hypothetical protein
MPNDGMEVKLSDSELAKLIEVRHDRDILEKHNDKSPEDVVKAPEDRQLRKAIDHLSHELARNSG